MRKESDEFKAEIALLTQIKEEYSKALSQKNNEICKLKLEQDKASKLAKQSQIYIEALQTKQNKLLAEHMNAKMRLVAHE